MGAEIRAPAYRNLAKPAKVEVDALVAMIRGLEPTAFAAEGPAVAALRATHCLAGWPFDRADLQARIVVLVALNRVGAVRPTWQDGQPVPLPLADRCCEVCDAPLYDAQEHNTCSLACAAKRNNDRWTAIFAERRRAARADLVCLGCGASLAHARRSDAKFCDQRCRYIWRRAQRGAGQRRLRAGSAEAGA